MARILIEKETIHTEEVDMLMQGKSVEEIVKYMEAKEAESNRAAGKNIEQPTPPAETPAENGADEQPAADESETKDGEKQK